MTPTITRSERILNILEERGRDNCGVVGELRRRTRCQCLKGLLLVEADRQQTGLALDAFYQGVLQCAEEPKRKKFAEKYRRDAKRPKRHINQPVSIDYELPVPEPLGQSNYVALCRSAMIELAHMIAPMDWGDAKQMFPTRIWVERRKRIDNLFHLVRYLHTHNQWFPINWSRALSGTALPQGTAKRYVKKYHLQQVASNCIKSVDKWETWLGVNFQGRVCVIPATTVQKTFPQFEFRGYQAQEKYDAVHRNSVGRVPKDYAATVQFRTVDPVENKNDADTEAGVQQWLKPIIANALDAPEGQCKITSAFLRSPGFAPQVSHYDFGADDRRDLAGRIHLGICPLTVSGCHLQVWRQRENEEDGPQQGEVLFVPKGRILLLPGETIHGGGFLSDHSTQDLRLHFYVYTDGVAPRRNNNDYQSVVDYPNSRDLEPGGLVHGLFVGEANALGGGDAA